MQHRAAGSALLTGMGRTTKNHLLPLLDKLLPRKRCSIATLLAKLKPGMGLEHTGHRSPINTFVPILSCLLAPAKANMGTSASLSLPPCLDLESELQRLCRRDRPPAVSGRAAVVQAQVFSANLPAG